MANLQSQKTPDFPYAAMLLCFVLLAFIVLLFCFDFCSFVLISWLSHKNSEQMNRSFKFLKSMPKAESPFSFEWNIITGTGSGRRREYGRTCSCPVGADCQATSTDWPRGHFQVKGIYRMRAPCLSSDTQALHCFSVIISHQPTKSPSRPAVGLIAFPIMVPFRNAMCPQISTQNPTHVNFRARIYEIILSRCFIALLWNRIVFYCRLSVYS